MFTVAALYKFVQVEDCVALQQKLKKSCEELGIIGTLLIATEGINGTIAGKEKSIDKILRIIKDDSRFSEIDVKFSSADERPFYRLKIRIKQECFRISLNF